MAALPPAVRSVVIALGSNVGDRHAALRYAFTCLSALLDDAVLSEIVETEPEGEGLLPGDQPLYLNAVVAGTTRLGPRDLLEMLLRIERDYGRERPYPGAPRTLDLDLILLGDCVVDEPGLRVPHPRFRSRFFVLGPLAGVAPALRDPVTGLTVAELLRGLLSDPDR